MRLWQRTPPHANLPQAVLKGVPVTTPPAPEAAPARLPLRERYAGFIVWFSLFASVLGLLSAFHDVIPMLTRLSLLTKALFAAYHIARDWAWHEVRWAFSWIHIRIPDIPVAWKDAIVIVSFVVAALNFENLRRHRISLIKSLRKSLLGTARHLLLNKDAGEDETWGLFGESAHSMEFPDWLIGAILFLSHFLEGYLVHVLLSILGIRFGEYFFPDPWGTVFDVSVFAAMAFLYLVLLAEARVPVVRSTSRIPLLFSIPMGLTILVLANGWRAIAFALGLIVLSIGTNFAFVQWIDPMLRHPPAFLDELIKADPASLPKSP